VNVTYSDYEASTFFDTNGNEQPLGGAFHDDYFTVYGEHAFDKENAIVWSANLLSLKRDFTPPLTNGGTGDWMVGWKHALPGSGNFVHAFELQVGYPTGYNTNAALPLGLNSTDVGALYELGNSFKVGKSWGYVDGYVGYRLRLGTPVDQIFYGAGVGVPAFERLQVFGRVNGVTGLGGKGDPILGPSILSNSFDILSGTAGLAYDIGPDFNLSASYVWDLIGRNTGKGATWQIGATVKY